ncbi:MAG TPA: ABC transporter ATP-binding protein [Acidimicrobiales bacterium]|jgi:ABC-2 type transport system ATP-binding protein
MPDTTPAVAVDGLTKRYGRRVAVDDLTVEVPRGVVAGFIGPNGAGKTTTMAMLLGLVRPTAGTGTVLGQPLDHPERYLRGVGALVEGPALWPALTGTENLWVLAHLGGHDPARVPAVLDLVGLTDRGDDRFGEYSLGMKQRLGIAAALLGDPALLVLDEPTNGLDPAGAAEVRGLVRDLGAGGRTVLVSSHVLSELEQACDWLLVIDAGRLVYGGPADGLRSAGPEIVLGPADGADLLRLADVVSGAGVDAGRQGDHLVVVVDGHDPHRLAASLNRAAASSGIVLAELHVRRPTLESRYLDLVRGGRR